MTNDKQPIDWPSIEKDYRAGSMPVREMARWYQISEGAIRKRAKAGEWERASTQPQPRTEPERVTFIPTPVTHETTSPEAIVGRGRNLTLRMLDELDATTSRVGDLEMMIDTAIDGADDGKQREALKQAISLKQRAEILKSLALAAKTLADSGAPAGKKAERQAAAEKVGKPGSKFAPPSAPKLVVDNGR